MTTPEPQPGIQGESGCCRDQGREDHERAGTGVRRSSEPDQSEFSHKELARAKRIKPDNNDRFAADQQAWPLHRKWMKELYEARSSHMHRVSKGPFSQNWRQWQHAVIATFVFPLIVKLKLCEGGFYRMTKNEQVACDTLDDLLDSDWAHGWRAPPEWPAILSMAQALRTRRTDLLNVVEKVLAPARGRETDNSPELGF